MNLEMAKARSKTFLDLLRFGGLLSLGLILVVILLESLLYDLGLYSVAPPIVFSVIFFAGVAVLGLMIIRKAGATDVKVKALLLGSIGLAFLAGLLGRFEMAALILPLAVSLTLLTLWIAALIAALAVEKGKDWTTFFVLAIFFPLITWVIVAVVNTDQAVPVSAMKTCPRCAELVKAEATLCKHCGSDIA